MKNIYLLPTEKPSRLGYLTKKGKESYNDLRLFDRLMPNILDSENQNIYITSDEKPKEGDWVYHKLLKSVFKIDLKEVSQEYIEERKNILKVILTTDPKLISDGIQVIDDEFLQWFVKNPSCERVEVQDWVNYYKVFIPQIGTSNPK